MQQGITKSPSCIFEILLLADFYRPFFCFILQLNICFRMYYQLAVNYSQRLSKVKKREVRV